jgi:branched-chain amino acid transport system substrate-binding protein
MTSSIPTSRSAARRSRLSRIAPFLVVTALVAACGDDSDSSDASESQAPDATEVAAAPTAGAAAPSTDPAGTAPAADAADESAAAPAETPTLTVGGVQPLTGPAAGVGQRMSNGARLAMDDLREEGVVDIDYVEEDAGADNTTALNAMRRVLGSDPQFILGPVLGTMNLALRPEIENAEVPMGVASGTRSITQNDNQWLLRFNPHDGIAKRDLATFAVEEQGIKRPAILHDSTEYGQLGSEILTETLEELGAPPVATEVMNPDDRDASAQMLRISEAEPDAVIVQIIGGATGAVALKELRTSGLDVPIFWSSGITSDSFLELVTEAEADGVYAETPIAPLTASDDPAVADFAATFQERFDMTPDAFSLIMYDGTRMVGEAVRSGARTPEEIRDALRSMTYEGLGGTYHSDEEGNLSQQTVIVQRTDGAFEVLKEYTGQS